MGALLPVERAHYELSFDGYISISPKISLAPFWFSRLDIYFYTIIHLYFYNIFIKRLFFIFKVCNANK